MCDAPRLRLPWLMGGLSEAEASAGGPPGVAAGAAAPWPASGLAAPLPKVYAQADVKGPKLKAKAASVGAPSVEYSLPSLAHRPRSAAMAAVVSAQPQVPSMPDTSTPVASSSTASSSRYQPSREEVAEQWLFTEEDLDFTPTVLAGILKPAEERKARRRGVGLIYKVAERSQL